MVDGIWWTKTYSYPPDWKPLQRFPVGNDVGDVCDVDGAIFFYYHSLRVRELQYTLYVLGGLRIWYWEDEK